MRNTWLPRRRTGAAFALIAAVAALLASVATANHLVVTNTTVLALDATRARIRFDIAWDNAWRWTNINHDAAWVFFKYQVEGETDWLHVRLKGAGLNPPDYNAGSGTNVDLIVPEDGIGLFVRKADEGAGRVAAQNIIAVWDMATNGLTAAMKVKVQTLAVEMAYVAEGAFWVGDGATDDLHAQLEDGTSGAPYAITNEAYEITLGGGGEGSLGNNNRTGMTWADDFSDTMVQTLPSAFPKGYAPFYCMKHEITEGQWVAFFNTLTDTQKGTHDITGSSGKGTDAVSYRNTVAWTAGDATTTAPDRACGYLRWHNVLAIADWAGLRPMTGLEFEKACRGPLPPVPEEYAWGSTIISNTTALLNEDTGLEMAVGGNCNYSPSSPAGPFRAGIYATEQSDRESAGASYWGILDLSGGQWERVVLIGGGSTARAYDGTHGDGGLSVNGGANASTWPAPAYPCAAMRGGSYTDSSSFLRVSDRRYGHADGYSGGIMGGRMVRTAPDGIGP